MNRPERIAIAAVTDEGVIGDSNHNEMPWRIGEYEGHAFWDDPRNPQSFRKNDMNHFGEETMYSALIMGRRTWESIPGFARPLKNRKNIVVSATVDASEGIYVRDSLDSALAAAQGFEKVFLMGGSGIYEEAMGRDLVDRLVITRIHEEFDGDVFFPPIGESYELVHATQFPNLDPAYENVAHIEFYSRK